MTKCILYIEDNPDNMRLVRRILSLSGYSVLEAENGMEGIALAEKHTVDLILLDINLPDIDGYEVARRLRSNPKRVLSMTPIIALTANGIRDHAGKALDAGCDVYMSKPINVRELRARVEGFLSSPN
jgi:two-component system cell cycle response regulator DivK